MVNSIVTSYKRLPEEKRRKLLILATIQCLSEFGLGGTTVRKIAERADISPNLITHHFSNKDTLVGAAYRFLAEQYHADYLAASEGVGENPLQRLQAYVGAAFQTETLDQDILRVWTSFWTSALTDPESIAAHVHVETAEQTRDYLKQLLRDVLNFMGRQFSEPEIHDLSIAIGSLVDGMWLTWGLNPNLFNAKDGRRIAFDMMASRMAIPELANRPLIM
jgi:TetR/AcrR family transcriptional repressor of bet genes